MKKCLTESLIFKKKYNLKVDGIMKPNGETENKLNEVLASSRKIAAGETKPSHASWENNRKENYFAQSIQNGVQQNIQNKSNNIDYSKYGPDVDRILIEQMLSDTKFQKALKRTKYFEGGYINDVNDSGKETNFGISSAVYPNENIKNMTSERANYIYYRDYWKKPKINTLPENLSDRIFDNAVNQGQQTAIKNLQKALNIQSDGIIGEETLNAIKNTDQNLLLEKFKDQVGRRYDEIASKYPKNKVYLNGWNNRKKSY